MALQVFGSGQKLLEKQRFQFPHNWLYTEQVDGEWGAFNDIMNRKEITIQNQMGTLQGKIAQEDEQVEQRTVELLTEWEKGKPVQVREINLQYYKHFLSACLPARPAAWLPACFIHCIVVLLICLHLQGNMRSDVALSGLATFEAKFQRIKDERDNVARAREALELPDTGECQIICLSR